MFRGEGADVEDLVHAAILGRDQPVYVNADSADIGTYEELGFTEVVAFESFSVSFESCVAQLDRARLPAWCQVIDAHAADVQRLSDLDNLLRSDIAGTEGWNAGVDWMRQEVSAPGVHRYAYLVATVRETGEYIGLIRVWRNPSGPRLGMVGVVKEFRGSLVGPALIQRALASASTWGFAEFVTETQFTNRSIYARLKDVGTSQGVFAQMRRVGKSSPITFPRTEPS